MLRSTPECDSAPDFGVVDRYSCSASAPPHSSVSESGTLVLAPGVSIPDATTGEAGDRVLTWVARAGRREPSGIPPRRYVMARIAPTGDAVALEVRDETVNVWTWELRTNRLTPLTTARARPEPQGPDALMISTGWLQHVHWPWMQLWDYLF